MKKYTAVYLKDLGIQIGALRDWIASEDYRPVITKEDILHYQEMLGEDEHYERVDARNLEQMMVINQIDIVIL